MKRIEGNIFISNNNTMANCSPGHIRSRQELGEGAPAAGVSVHRDRSGREQERPGRQEDGRVRGGAGLRRRERPALHGDQRQDCHER